MSRRVAARRGEANHESSGRCRRRLFVGPVMAWVRVRVRVRIRVKVGVRVRVMTWARARAGARVRGRVRASFL